ncbi:hypothetical protein CI109_106520 [Kwoniella shandongensis]|uniref:Kinetochore protein NDC80 n=1 Tax=Kwoniella shandongensis TaxID=1734106 RepID=A0AAJ8N0E8_9TREE
MFIASFFTTIFLSHSALMDLRRGTLASEGPIGNALPSSSIPVPSSAVKKPASRLGAPRPSMALSHSQLQPGTHTTTTANAGRRSIMLTSKVGESRESIASATRGDAGMYGRTPQTMRSMPSSIRRSSVFPSSNHARPSIAPGLYSSVVPKDPRPLRDKGFQTNCMRNINDYLVNARYPAPMTPKTLVSPTLKEFQSILRFLVNDLIDPGMTWSKKFDDDALTVLKDLRYPGLDSINKTAFTAPGAPQSWPAMLAMLNWLVELCKAHENWSDPNCISDPLLTPVRDLPLDHPNLEDRLLWDFSSKTYTQWFDGGAEEFPDAEQELAEIYERMAVTTVDECAKLETTAQKRNVELQQLHAQEPPLKKMEDEYVQLMSDKTKFIAFIDLHRQKAEKTKQAISKIRSAIYNQEISSHRSELQRIEQAVAVQNLSPDEVNRMTHERESLTRNLEDLRNKIVDASQFAYDQEMMVTKSMDRFETLLADYTALAHQIGVIHPTPEESSSSSVNVDYAIDLDLGAEDLEEVRAAGTKLRSSIWHGLQAYRETFRQQALDLSNVAIVLDDQFDRLGQKVERQKEEVGNLEVRLKVVHEQAEDAQSQLTSENADTNKIIAQLEAEVTNMLAASQQGVLATQSQLESTRIAFKELRHKTALLQDSMVTQVGSHIDVIIKAKEHAANSLRSIRSLAETQ